MHRWLLAKANVWSFPNTPSEAAGDSVWKVDSKVCECSVPLGLVYIVNTSTLAPFLIDLGICLESFLSICSLLVLSWFLEYKGTTLWLEDLESTGANGSQTAAASSWVPPRSVQFILRIWKRKRLLSSSDIKVPPEGSSMCPDPEGVFLLQGGLRFSPQWWRKRKWPFQLTQISYFLPLSAPELVACLVHSDPFCASQLLLFVWAKCSQTTSAHGKVPKFPASA